MVPNKVVVKCKDNTVVKGRTTDFFPNKAQFHLEEINGKISEISLEDLKAVFFVKDFNGNKDHQDNYNDQIAAGGREIEVLFNDGERVVGYTLTIFSRSSGFLYDTSRLTR